MSAGTVRLNDGRAMPRLGLGIWEIPDAETARVVREAVGLGYRLIDGAVLYGNETGLGEGVRACGVPREELWVTTKVWSDHHGFDACLRSVEGSLRRLGLDRIDMVLIHWPSPQKNLYVETWKALVRLREEGRVSSVGVSNFIPEHLERVADATGVVPAVNQVEMHPELPQRELRKVHARMGVVTQAWTPLGEGRSFGAAPVRAAAERTGATPAQVVLAWSLAVGGAPIPRSQRRERLAENFSAAEVKLTAEEVEAIGALETGRRCGPDPERFG